MQLVGGGSFFTIVIGLVSQENLLPFLSLPQHQGVLQQPLVTEHNAMLFAVCIVSNFEHSQEPQQLGQAG